MLLSYIWKSLFFKYNLGDEQGGQQTMTPSPDAISPQATQQRIAAAAASQDAVTQEINQAFKQYNLTPAQMTIIQQYVKNVANFNPGMATTQAGQDMFLSNVSEVQKYANGEQQEAFRTPESAVSNPSFKPDALQPAPTPDKNSTVWQFGYNGQEYYYVPASFGAGGGGKVNVSPQAAALYGGVPFSMPNSGYVSNFNPNGYLFATNPYGFLGANAKGVTQYTPGTGGDFISSLENLAFVPLVALTAGLGGPLAGLGAAAAGPEGPGAEIALAGAGIGAGISSALGTASGIGGVADVPGGLEIPAGTTAGGISSGLGDVMPGAEAAAGGATGGISTGASDIMAGANAVSSGATGGLGSTGALQDFNTATLPPGATASADGVKLANGINITLDAATAAGKTGLGLLNSLPTSVSGAVGTISDVNKISNLVKTLTGLAAGGAAVAGVAGAAGGGGSTATTTDTTGLAALASALGLGASDLNSLLGLGMSAAQIATLENEKSNYEAAYASSQPLFSQTQTYNTGLSNAAKALQEGPSNPLYAQLLETNKNLIMQGVQQTVTTLRNDNNEQIARSGIGFLNPERRDETMARTLASAEEKAQVDAQNQVLQQLTGAITAGTPVSDALQKAAVAQSNKDIAAQNTNAALTGAQIGLAPSMIGAITGASGGVGGTGTPGASGTTPAAGAGTTTAGGTPTASALQAVINLGGAAGTAAQNLYNSLFGAATTGSLGAVSGLDVGAGSSMAPVDAAGNAMSGSDITNLLAPNLATTASDWGTPAASDLGSSVTDALGF